MTAVDTTTDATAGPAARAATWLRHPLTTAVVFVVAAAVAVTTSAPGRYVGENRLDQYFAPGHRLVRSAFVWDPTRGLGRTREDLWPLQLGPLAALRGWGLSPVAAQRVWHALLLATAAIGAAAVVRVVRDDRARRRAGEDVDPFAPLLAGLLYGFGPYSITFLTPANLYAAYAVAPWVVVCALRGPGDRRPWRWAAGAALLIGALGNADYPGVVLSLVAVPFAAAWSARRVGRGLGRALVWLAGTAALTVGVSAAALWKTAAASAVFAQRVSSTESPQVVGVASSWSETWRGLGFWLSYFRSDVLARPQTAELFTSPVAVLITFVPAVLALVALALPEVRGRVLFGSWIVAAGVLMVGVHPIDDPPPLGAALLDLLEIGPVTTGFRTTYKAGAGLVLGVAALAGLGAAAVTSRAGRGQGRALAGGALAAVVVAVCLPAWTGGLYDETRTSGPVPAYWEEAARAVNELPGDGRILVLPASTRTVYDWGWVGDDILDSLITRPHAVDTAVPLSGPEAADVLAAVSAAADDARHRPGAVSAVLRRLGIDHVLIRNDIDAAATRTLSPEQMSLLRADPSLRRVRTFGGRLRDEGLAATSITELGQEAVAPLELFVVDDPGPVGPRLAPADGQLLVSGSGDAMVALGAGGDLDATGPVRFSGALDAAAMRSTLDDGGRLVLSDTNRRRVTVVNALVRNESWTLAEGQDLDREAGALFDTPGSQSVAWYRDATTISSTGVARGARGSQPWTRPAAAFDGEQSTWWQTLELRDQEGITLRADLREPAEIGRVRVDPLAGPRSAQRVTEVTVRFSDGTTQRLDVSGGATEVDVSPGPTEWVEIEITGVSDGAAGPVGLREVELGLAGDTTAALDLREWIALPDDVVRAAGRDEVLAEALADAPVSVVMARDQPEAPFPVEPVLRRRFRLPRAIDATLTATVVPRDPATVDLLTGLRGECGADTVAVDGEPVGMAVDEDAVVLVGTPVTVTSCEPLALGEGWRELEVDAGAALDAIRLDSLAPATVATGTDGAVEVVAAGPDRLRLRVDAPDGGVVLTGQSHDARWVATIDGEDLGPAGLYDGQAGWEVPAGTDLDVEIRFRPGTPYRAAQWVSLLTVAACLALVVGRRPRTA